MLFHLGEDLAETRDRADRQPELVMKLQKAYQQWENDVAGHAIRNARELHDEGGRPSYSVGSGHVRRQ
jgi:hypothetical protein